MQVNIGGDRLGSGAKMQVDLHNYNRSTHNLSKNFKSSLASGCLYPAYVNVGLNGDKFEMDIKSLVRTLPTQGPLFGSYKMQVDVFVAPFRLYQGILHNNPINIGMQMSNVKLPKVRLFDKGNTGKTDQVHPSNLWKYLGLSGLGRKSTEMSVTANMFRDINAIPLLAYYDIFKNYYANKQEDNAYVITPDLISLNANIVNVTYAGVNFDVSEDFDVATNNGTIIVEGTNLYVDGKIQIGIFETSTDVNITSRFGIVSAEANKIVFSIGYTGKIFIDSLSTIYTSNGINLSTFALENIDKMREFILKNTELGETLMINEFVENNNIIQPYAAACQFDGTKRVGNQSQPMCGLVVKTYQSDLFNNWIKTETIDGENGIKEVTRIDTTNGLELDALNLAQKVYNMLNRIAVSGGTYEDYLEAVWTTSVIRKAETPMYMGGMSSEIMFEEVVATTANETTLHGNQSLGSLGGRGKEISETKKGGHIEFTIEEPSIIMAIVSLTPRVCYSQGNKFYLTELDSIDDLHKPALDGIGYQDLLAERMAWWGTQVKNSIDGTNPTTELIKESVGKVPAWIEYMTDVDECYGDFALDAATSFMVLNRDYEIADDGTLQDPTTYIDPGKYNYAFAYNKLFAQNFWCEIQFNITARRLMSAKQIPNL